MFLAHRKQIYRISHLYFDKQSEKILQTFKSAYSGPYNIPLKFINSQQKATLWNRFFLDRQLERKFKYVINFIDQCGKNTSQKNKQKFPKIEDNLFSNIQNFIKSRPQQIIVHQCKVGRAFYIEQKKIHGVFFHRKLNLAKSCYSTEYDEKNREIKYRMKGKLRNSEQITQFEKIRKMYQNSRFPFIYRDTYEGFQKSEYITRSLLKIVADLKVQIRLPQFQQSIRLGYGGLTQHILQFQTYKSPYQQEQYAITDIDFFLQGNYHFLKN